MPFLALTMPALAQNDTCNLLCNIDFDDAQVATVSQVAIIDQSKVPCWKTTASDKMIEIWASGFYGVPSYSGNQFAELNANEVSTLYQDFTASLGSTILLSFAHRGRYGTDVLSVEIGPVGGPYTSLGSFSADNTAWKYNTTSYTVPSTGTTNYTLRFKSVSAAGGNPGYGNFLDAISLNLSTATVSAILTHPGCSNASNGAIKLKVTGGKGPFTYKWQWPLTSTIDSVQFIDSGDYQVIIEDIYGCKIKKSYTLLPKFKNSITVQTKSACDSFKWSENNTTYKNNGNYTANYKTVHGCDSVITLKLSVHKTNSTNWNIKKCNTYVWPIDGKTYTKSGIYTVKLNSYFGCDSIQNLHLTIDTPTYSYDTASSCNDYLWAKNNTLYNQSGHYTYTLKNAAGCDSTQNLHLNIYPHSYTVFTVKTTEKYLWPTTGLTYYQDGKYIEKTKSVYGCDSVLELNLTLITDDSIFISNTFTPDGNSINDKFRPMGNNIVWYQIKIFNRWGEMLFSGNQNLPFDGTYMGKPLPDGVYAYNIAIMNKRGDRKYFKGTVTVVR